MSSAAIKKTQENMNQKLALVIKSGKFKLGKLSRVSFKSHHAARMAQGPSIRIRGHSRMDSAGRENDDIYLSFVQVTSPLSSL